MQTDHGDDDENGLKFIFINMLLNHLIDPDDTDTDHLEALCFTPEDTCDTRQEKVQHILQTVEVALLCIACGADYCDEDGQGLFAITLGPAHKDRYQGHTFDQGRINETAIVFLVHEGADLNQLYTCKAGLCSCESHNTQSTPLADIALSKPDLLDLIISQNPASVYGTDFHKTVMVLTKIDRSRTHCRRAQAQLRKLLARLPETFDRIAFCEGLMTANGDQFDLEALPMLIKALQCDDTLHHCLQLAAWSMHEELIARLMDAGADPHALNSKGNSALSLAAHHHGQGVSRFTWTHQYNRFYREKSPITPNEIIYVMLDHPSFTYQQDTAAAVLHAIPRWKDVLTESNQPLFQETEMMWEPGKAELLKILLTGMDQADVFGDIAPSLENAGAGASTSATGPSLTTGPTDTVRKTFLEGLLLCFGKQSKKLISLTEGAAMFATRQDGGGRGLVVGNSAADKITRKTRFGDL